MSIQVEVQLPGLPRPRHFLFLFTKLKFIRPAHYSIGFIYAIGETRFRSDIYSYFLSPFVFYNCSYPIKRLAQLILQEF